MQISLRQLFMLIAAISLLLCLTQAEGCGARVQRIDSISFSPDGKLIALARFDARDARTPGKGYLRDVSRTISVVDATSGRQIKRVQQDVRKGNCGPAFGLFEFAHGDLAFVDNDRLLIKQFGRGPVDEYKLATASRTQFIKAEVSELAVSADGSAVAVAVHEEVRVVPLAQDQASHVFPNKYFSPFSPSFAITSEDGLVTKTANGCSLWNLDSGTVEQLNEIAKHRIYNIAVWEENRLMAFSDFDNSLYFANRAKSEEPTTLASGILRHTFAKRPDSNLLAYVTRSAVEYTLVLQDPVKGNSRKFPLQLGTVIKAGPTSMKFSRDGSTIAMGDSRGQLQLIDVESGRRLWTTKTAGRHRLPWTVPVILLVLLAWLNVRNRSSSTEDNAVGS